MSYRLVISQIRNEAGLSQAELGRLARTSQSAVARYESGATVPSLPTLERLFAACGRRLELNAATDVSSQSASASVRGRLGTGARALREKRKPLMAAARRHGLRDVRVFGSVARGDEGPASDIDVLVSLPRDRTLLDLISFQQEAQKILGSPVDVATLDMLKPRVRQQAEAEALRL